MPTRQQMPTERETLTPTAKPVIAERAFHFVPPLVDSGDLADSNGLPHWPLPDPAIAAPVAAVAAPVAAVAPAPAPNPEEEAAMAAILANGGGELGWAFVEPEVEEIIAQGYAERIARERDQTAPRQR